MIAGCWLYVSIVGKEINARVQYDNKDNIIFTAEVFDDSTGAVTFGDVISENGELSVRIKSVEPGRVYVQFVPDREIGDDARPSLIVLYVHESGIITQGDYFGYFNGMLLIRVCILIYFLLCTVDLITKYRKTVKENMYQYRCIMLAGVIIFMVSLEVFMLFSLFTNRMMGLVDVLTNIMGALETIALLTFPIILVVSIVTMISNIQLMRKEGRSWRNMLGFILGITLLIASLMPMFISEYLQQTTIIDVHQWTGTGRFIGMFIENLFGSVIVYSECILCGTIILGVKAARHIPAFNKDYILIHGCQIRKDGTLTKLLQSRADRAVEFASMQKNANGKDIIFVPSGGKGSDEIISEAEAIANYLKSIGIPDSAIMIEDRSTTTEENIRFSADLIRESGGDISKIAIATTNYHVFRAGMLANSQGIKVEGIGSKTKQYFWINAFIREFIATLVSEYKTHVVVIGILVLTSAAIAVFGYISTAVLS